ncbi:GNAT family N-acetyltransferase [Marinilabilia sp.]|uniref:GNAT family N-acetyltransferase n=1 Tax=Marinilabilia sp. TaxID=2021252 RepID=UPI0025C6A490|nr:GNAT family N-acetyltransferase [Marinilabilia sp.]
MQLLNEENYSKLLPFLKEVEFNNLFARSVAEKHVKGKIYVDNPERPETFYVLHPYGMSLLFGNPFNTSFNRQFREYAIDSGKKGKRLEWMQAWPQAWDQVLVELLGGRLIRSEENTSDQHDGIVELNTRVNFRFELPKYFLTLKPEQPAGVSVVPTNEKLFHEMKGGVVPGKFWNCAEDLLHIGKGYSLLYNGRLAATAYSAFVHEATLELGIETQEEYRGMGFAVRACSALIDYCIENGYEPVWACRLENTGSYNLARKLGFEPCREIPYYRLGN